VALVGVEVRATDFSGAFLRRTQWGKIDPEQLGAVRLNNPVWTPVWGSVDKPDVPWDAKAYAELRDSVENIPEGKMRDAALRRIEILDCGNPDKTLASCDPTAKPPHEVLDWQNRLAQASIDGAAYAKALATEFQSLVCANDANEIYILRGLLGVFPVRPRLAATGRKAREQIEFIMSEKCAVSASLTDDDKAKLLQIKQDTPQAPQKDK
jgi:hypothetical protein